MKRYLLAAIGALLIVPASAAQAQVCIGMGSMAAAPMNLRLGVEFGDNFKTYGARFGFGSSIMFGGVSGSIVDADGSSETAKAIGIDGGLSYVVGTARNVVVCPIAELSYTMLPDVGLDDGRSITTGGAGLAVGASMRAGATMTLIPFASLQALYSRFDYDLPVTSEDSETYGMLSGGLSFALTEAVLIRPVINIPLGLDNADPSYGVAIAFSIGRR